MISKMVKVIENLEDIVHYDLLSSFNSATYRLPSYLKLNRHLVVENAAPYRLASPLDELASPCFGIETGSRMNDLTLLCDIGSGDYLSSYKMYCPEYSVSC